MPCPTRFAFYFGCQEEAIHTALKSFDDRGAGKYMSGQEFTEFKTKALNICVEYRNMNTFRREIIEDPEDHAEDRIYIESEEEKPQYTRA